MMHPKRLSGKPSNIAKYYSIGDYYSKGANEPSEWGGAIAAELGLAGAVDKAQFEALLGGKVREQQLGRHMADGTIDHHPGWDFAISAPKSVSIMALVAGDERVAAAHEAAVTVALAYLEEHAATRRRENGEVIHETTGRLLFARFTEHASRELDAHLHTHVVVLNLTNRGDEQPMTSLETRAMFAEQKTAGQVYRNALAHDLRELGYEVEHSPRSGLFEITDVPKDLIADSSKRKAQIDKHAAAHGLEGQEERRRAFYATRNAKEKVGVDELVERWKVAAGPDFERLEALRDAAREREATIEPDPADSRRAMLFGLRHAEEKEAVNNRGLLLRGALAAYVGDVRLGDIEPLLAVHENRGKLLTTRAETGDQVLTRGRTSRQTARLEIKLAHELTLSVDDAAPLAAASRVGQVLETAGLNKHQEMALAHIATSRDRVIGVEGVAGAGKSTLVRALVEAAGSEHNVLALAPTSSAAAELAQKAGTPFQTVAEFLARGGRDHDERSVLVVDEAAMLGSRSAVRLLEISRESGARLIMLGDTKQNAAIDQGKPYWLLQELGLATNKLPEAVRQETRSMKQSVAAARDGRWSEAFGGADRITAKPTTDALAAALVEQWVALSAKSRSGTAVLVLDNATRAAVNEQIRTSLKREGVVAAEDTRLQILTSANMSNEERRTARFYSGGQVVTFSRDQGEGGLARDTEYKVVGLGRDKAGRQIVRLVDENGLLHHWDPRTAKAQTVNVFKSESRDLAAGDRIQWRIRSRNLNLRNAQRGSVERLEGGLATIAWDNGQHQIVDLGRHKSWDHGYAETVHASQSKTYDRAFVLAPVKAALVNEKTMYTAISRARLGYRLFTQDDKRLIATLERRSGEKTSALEGLGRLATDHVDARTARFGDRIDAARDAFDRDRRDARIERQQDGRPASSLGELVRALAANAARVIARTRAARGPDTAPMPGRPDRDEPQQPRGLDR